MTIDTLLRALETKGISLAVKGEQLVVRGDKAALADEALRTMLRDRKPELIAHLLKDGFVGRSAANFVAPANAVPAEATQIRPEMLTLVSLTQEQIDGIAGQVPGGHANIQDIYPLAPLQEGILFHHQLQQNDAYVLPMLIAFDSRQGLDRFVQTMNQVIARHDILRTSVAWDGLDEPVQVVWRQAQFELEVFDFPEGDVKAQLLARADPRRYRLDVRQAPMMRGFAASDPEGGRWLLQFLFHHLAIDQITSKLLIGEVALIQQGRASELPAAWPFRNFVAQARLGVTREAHEAFFREMLGDVDEPTAPFGLLDIQGDGSLMREAHLQVEPELALRLRRQARQRGLSVASVFHLAFAQVLAKSAGRDDVVFGTVLFGRMQGGAGAEGAIGMFINTLPLRVRLGEQSVLQSAQATHNGLIGLLNHEHASLTLAQQCSSMSATAPLFSAVLNYRYGGQPGQEESTDAFDGMQVLGGEEARTNYPFALAVNDQGEGFLLTARVIEAIGAQRAAQFVHKALQQLVDALEHAPDTPVCTLQVLSDAERERVVRTFNDTARPYPRDALIHELFEQQVQAHPDAIALAFEDQVLSYAELNARANRLARVLRQRGVGHGDCVGTHLDRSIELVVAQLAILKCAAAYVPLDRQMPEHRKSFMLQDARARWVIVQQEEWAVEGIECIDLNATDLQQGEEGNLERSSAASSEDAVYVMYTSGSTGQPKGVVVPHRGVSRLVSNNGYASFDATDRVAFAANPAFDASTMEVWAPLLNGGCCVIVAASTFIDPLQIERAIEDQRISVMFMTTALFNQYAVTIPRALGKLRYLLCGGERNDPESFARVLAEGGPGHLIHCYGPTETTTFAVTAEIASVPADGTSLPIGKPISNTQVYILDPHRQPVPVGVAGEMYIGGAGVALGYLNQPELTAERFVADPFSMEAGARMYKTGDLARWHEDGAIEFLGRNDHQVKIRGFRIELGEIEAQLVRLPGIREAVVLARGEDMGEKRLVAYVVAAEGGLDVGELRASLEAVLPEYMVPAAFVPLHDFPLTPNGKLDRNALPAPDAVESEVQYVAPRTATEKALSQIWSEVLKVERVGLNDDFFELGGHSLLAGQLISRVRSQLGVEVALAELFVHSVLEEFAQAVEASGVTELPPIETRDHNQAAQLSFAQQRLWFMAQLDPRASAAYNIPAEVKLRGELDVDALQRALDRIVERHESLRTHFELQDGEPVQRISQQMKFPLQMLDLGGAADPEQETERQAQEEASQAFDLGSGPMVRGRLLKLAEHEHVLLATMHHIVSDGWSMGVLIRELSALYEAFSQGQEDPLPPLQIQYADYAVWQRRWLSGEVQNDQLAFWKKTLQGAPELTELATDRVRPAVQDYTGDSVEFALDAKLSQDIHALARRRGTTPFNVLLAGWAALVGRLSGQSDIVIGTPVANRTRTEVEPLIGFFVNTLALRIDLSGQPGAGELVQRVHELTLAAQEHQDLPFEQVVELINPERSMAYAPLAQLMLRWQKNDEGRLSLGEVQLEAVHTDSHVARYELDLALSERGDCIVGHLGYATSLFDRSSIERHLRYLKDLLQGMVDDESQPVEELAFGDEDEREQLLHGWNDTDVEFEK